jgi:hypothetical protein
MNKLVSFVALAIFSFTLVGCGNDERQPLQPELMNNNYASTFSSHQVGRLEDAKFNESEFSKFAESRDIGFYNTIDSAFTTSYSKSSIAALQAHPLPYKTYTSLVYDLKQNYEEDITEATTETANDLDDFAKKHYERNKYAFEYLQNAYKATPTDIKRFIIVDTLVNSLLHNHVEFHNAEYTSTYKLNPVKAAHIMPTFAEINKFNFSDSTVSYVKWDDRRAKEFYQSNYARYMGLIMEYAPNRITAMELIHKEICNNAAE